ncbi:MAG: NUDIX hydrolase [Pseudonocardiaceae bacterium]
MRVAWVVVTAGLLIAAAGAIRAATRLDRLHVRTDAAWAALDAALCRRARTVSELNGRLSGVLSSGGALRWAADAALLADGHPAPLAGEANSVHEENPARAEVENELGRLLAVLDRRALEPAYAGRLADAEQRVVIARRVYNDAVRDTLALRSHRMVRWLRLAGTAAAPRYFDIAEPLVSE